ncbi:hypothetical protein [Actinomadura hibisca]|uniref:hypothetical protein n=1 Tax=Actinomadura hibisca TaxID=68565 RepID=UPI000B27D353|nr:hypothetical protein [Actinomadura hibisca]
MGLGIGPDAVTAALVPVPESLGGLPAGAVAVWTLAGLGWLVLVVTLRRGVRGDARGPVLFGHVLTLPALLATFAILGYGSLPGLIALTAEWWALLAVTGFRPERLLVTGGMVRLAAWLVLAAAAAVVGTRLVL